MTFTTIPTSGSKVRASTFSDLINECRPVSAVKTLTTNRNTTTTRTADPDLTIALPANSEWEFVCSLVLTSAANAAGDWSGEFAYPAGADVSHKAHGLDVALPAGALADLGAAGAAIDSASPTSAFGFGCSTTGTSVLITGRIRMGATAGSLTLNWAQNVSNANNTSVFSGSSLVATRVA